MAKRYYKSMKKRDLYSGYDDRRRLEYLDSQMIKEDRSSIANLPQQVVMKEYPRTPYYNQPGLEDTIRGIDYQMGKDVNAKTIKKGKMPEKY